jgi:hypothetical protein
LGCWVLSELVLGEWWLLSNSRFASEGPLSVSLDSGVFFLLCVCFLLLLQMIRVWFDSRYVSTSGMVGMLRYQRVDAHNYLGTQFLFLEQDLYT